MEDLEYQYWKFQNELNLSEYIIPVNIAEEKSKFLSHYEKGRKYNPKFRYKEFKFNKSKAIFRLKKYKGAFSEFFNPISKFYLELIEEDIMWIDYLYERDSHEFPDWLSGIYGKPDHSLYKRALANIKSLRIETDDTEKIFPKEMKKLVLVTLKERNIAGWDVTIESSASRISVNAITKKIRINESAYFTSSEIDGLMMHEIGTHVLRYENGCKQPYLLFEKGFPNYLKTEEGLAVLSESKSNLLSSKDLSKYCARLMAAYVCIDNDFWDTFSSISTLIDVNDAFDIIARVKRGLVDSELHGGFTKDQIYYQGYLELQNLPQKKISLLYLGKIGVEHLSIIDQLDDISLNIELPDWLEND